MELEKIRLEEELKKDRELAKQAILAMGFSEDKDLNSNNVPDVVEYAKLLVEQRKLQLAEKVADEKIKSLDKKVSKPS